MAADVYIFELTGASAGTDKSSADKRVRFKSADEVTVDTTNRLSIPAAGSIYSYTKQLQFRFKTAPSVDISNLRFYTDGSNNFGTGIDIQFDKQSSHGANACANISGTGLFTITSGSPGTLCSNGAAFATTGYHGSILRLQMSVANTASPGALATERLTFSYDET